MATSLVRRAGLVLVTVLAAVGLAACGGGGTGAAGDGGDGAAADGEPTTAEFVGVDIDWKDAPDQIPAGKTTLVLENQGEQRHTLAIEGVGGEGPLVETKAGKTARTTVDLEPGKYTFYCTVAGHRAAGMEGTFQVTE